MSRISGKKVFVTGAGGFIGSHLTEELVRQGAKVKAMVRYTSRGTYGWLDASAKELRAEMEVVQGDLRNADFVTRAIAGSDIVFHLGAMIAIPYSYLSPCEAVAVNVQGTLNVLNACRTSGKTRMVHTSTSEVYGTAQYVPIDEKHPLQGQSPYSASKIGADKICESFYNSFSLPVAIVRPFNTFGPRQSARAVIPTIIVQKLKDQAISLGSLTPTRDFTFVSDTVAAMILAGVTDSAIGKTMNLGTGQEISIGDLVKEIDGLMGKPSRIKTADERIRPEKSEVNRLLSNNSLARETLKWAPAVSLKEGLRKTISWLESNQGQYERAKEEYVV